MEPFHSLALTSNPLLATQAWFLDKYSERRDRTNMRRGAMGEATLRSHGATLERAPSDFTEVEHVLEHSKKLKTPKFYVLEVNPVLSKEFM